MHGDLQKAFLALALAGVLREGIGREPIWCGGDATVVQLGDVLDRGAREIGELFLPWREGPGQLIVLSESVFCCLAIAQLKIRILQSRQLLRVIWEGQAPLNTVGQACCTNCSLGLLTWREGGGTARD